MISTACPTQLLSVKRSVVFVLCTYRHILNGLYLPQISLSNCRGSLGKLVSKPNSDNFSIAAFSTKKLDCSRYCVEVNRGWESFI